MRFSVTIFVSLFSLVRALFAQETEELRLFLEQQSPSVCASVDPGDAVRFTELLFPLMFGPQPLPFEKRSLFEGLKFKSGFAIDLASVGNESDGKVQVSVLVSGITTATPGAAGRSIEVSTRCPPSETDKHRMNCVQLDLDRKTTDHPENSALHIENLYLPLEEISEAEKIAHFGQMGLGTQLVSLVKCAALLLSKLSSLRSASPGSLSASSMVPVTLYDQSDRGFFFLLTRGKTYYETRGFNYVESLERTGRPSQPADMKEWRRVGEIRIEQQNFVVAEERVRTSRKKLLPRCWEYSAVPLGRLGRLRAAWDRLREKTAEEEGSFSCQLSELALEAGLEILDFPSSPERCLEAFLPKSDWPSVFHKYMEWWPSAADLGREVKAETLPIDSAALPAAGNGSGKSNNDGYASAAEVSPAGEVSGAVQDVARVVQ